MKFISYIKTLVFAAIIFGTLWYFIKPTTSLELVEKPEILLGLFILILLILFNGKISRDLKQIRFDKFSEEEKVKQLKKQTQWYENLVQKLVDSKPIEEESDIIMNHDYDGIKELDNNLPPWWLYGFYATIIFAGVYLSYYHIFGGDNQETEFKKEMAIAKAEIEAYKKTAKDLIDANTVTLLTEPTDLANGKKTFQTNCAVCHLADGGGSIGPNLTDEYWILGGGIKNVFITISEGGREGKGMIPWKQSLKPSEIQEVASYVLSLQGTIPTTPKIAEGEVWKEEK